MNLFSFLKRRAKLSDADKAWLTEILIQKKQANLFQIEKLWVGIIPNGNQSMASDLKKVFDDAGWIVDSWRQEFPTVSEDVSKGIWVSGRNKYLMKQCLGTVGVKAKTCTLEDADDVIVCGG